MPMLGISTLEGYQVDTLEAVCLIKRDTLVCVPTGSQTPCFERFSNNLNLHRDLQCHWQKVSSLVIRHP